MSTSVPSVPSLHSVFPELESWVPSSATHRHGYQGRRAARMQISEGPRDAPPAGIKGGAGRAPDLRSRCLPGAGRALPRSLLPRVPACRLQLRQSPAAPGKDSKPSCYKSQGWGASCQDRNERGATSVPSVESVLPWVLVVWVCTFSMGTWETGAHTTLSLAWQVASPQEESPAHWSVCPQAMFTQVAKNNFWFVQG